MKEKEKAKGKVQLNFVKKLVWKDGFFVKTKSVWKSAKGISDFQNLLKSQSMKENYV